jgi:hypothetical protein
MRACDHLLNRAGDKVYMDKTYVSNMLKKDVKIYRHIIEQAYIYLKHDMVRTKSLPMHLIYYIFNMCIPTYVIFYFRSSYR